MGTAPPEGRLIVLHTNNPFIKYTLQIKEKRQISKTIERVECVLQGAHKVSLQVKGN